jgi:hypothetical protein
MVQGQLFHACLFERDKVLDMFEVNDGLGKLRSNKKWQEAQSKTKKAIISTDELNHATRMVEALNKHEIVRDLLSGGVEEKPFFWEDKEWGIACKAKLDLLKNTEEGLYTIDYKTTGKINENTRYIDKANLQYDVGFYSRAVKVKYGKPLAKFIFLFQSSKEGEENDIRIKVVESHHLEACEIATDKAVREIVPKIQEYLKEPKEQIWLPNVVAESFECSPYWNIDK